MFADFRFEGIDRTVQLLDSGGMFAEFRFEHAGLAFQCVDFAVQHVGPVIQRPKGSGMLAKLRLERVAAAKAFVVGDQYREDEEEKGDIGGARHAHGAKAVYHGSINLPGEVTLGERRPGRGIE